MPAEAPAAPAPAEEPAAPAPAAPAPAEAPAAPAPAAKPADDPFATSQNELRIWTDDTGKYQVEARFTGTLEDGTVRLIRADGRYIRVAFHRLSLPDQQFLRDRVETIAMSW